MIKSHHFVLLICALFFNQLGIAHAKPHSGVRPVLSNEFLAHQNTPLSKSFITPKVAVVPFHQWNQNNGYCGEVSSIQAGLSAGQWMSQYNARLICGTGVSQSGADGFCEKHGEPNYNAQFLIENMNPGDARFANAGQCLKNARLNYALYDYSKQPDGMAGYKHYLAWIKAQVIAGNTVVIAILNHGGGDPQYDHEVTVNKIGTNHNVSDPTYYGDDVIYFEDHSGGGGPFVQGYTFDSMAKSRDGANSFGAGSYSILIPGGALVFSKAGGNGIDDNPHAIRPSNLAFSVSGPLDPTNVTLPVALSVQSKSSGGSLFAEYPELDSGCTNRAPRSPMPITLNAAVSGLTSGTAYNLYRYDFASVKGVGDAAALKVPESKFNAQASLATEVTHFVATGSTYTQTIQSSSDKVVVFRCVKADAP